MTYYLKTYSGNIYIIVGFCPNGYCCKPCLTIEEDGNREEIFEVYHKDIAIAGPSYQKVKNFVARFHVWKYDWEGLDSEGLREYVYRSYHISKSNAFKYRKDVIERQRKYPIPYAVKTYTESPESVTVGKDIYNRIKVTGRLVLNTHQREIKNA